MKNLNHLSMVEKKLDAIMKALNIKNPTVEEPYTVKYRRNKNNKDYNQQAKFHQIQDE